MSKTITIPFPGELPHGTVVNLSKSYVSFIRASPDKPIQTQLNEEKKKLDLSKRLKKLSKF